MSAEYEAALAAALGYAPRRPRPTWDEMLDEVRALRAPRARRDAGASPQERGDAAALVLQRVLSRLGDACAAGGIEDPATEREILLFQCALLLRGFTEEEAMSACGLAPAAAATGEAAASGSALPLPPAPPAPRAAAPDGPRPKNAVAAAADLRSNMRLYQQHAEAAAARKDRSR